MTIPLIQACSSALHRVWRCAQTIWVRHTSVDDIPPNPPHLTGLERDPLALCELAAVLCNTLDRERLQGYAMQLAAHALLNSVQARDLAALIEQALDDQRAQEHPF